MVITPPPPALPPAAHADREVTAATELRHPLYALAPSPALAGYEVRLSAALASASLRANADRQVAGPEGDAAAVRELAATCLDAARLLPPGCKLKLHFNLGGWLLAAWLPFVAG